MKVTIITDPLGNLVGTVMGHSLSAKQGDFEAGISLESGQKAHFVEVDNDLEKLSDPNEFHSRVKKYIPRS
jgi:hypothetical protein